MSSEREKIRQMEELRKQLGYSTGSNRTTSTTKSSNRSITTKSSNIAPTKANTVRKQIADFDRLREELGYTRDSINSRMTVDDSSLEEDIAPVDEKKKWYQTGHFEDGWDFGDVAKTILGIQKEETSKNYVLPEDPAPELTLDDLKTKLDDSKKLRGTEKLKESKASSELYNQKYVAQNSELLADTVMDGFSHSVLDEMRLVSEMESGKEKRTRKKAVLKKLEELGIDAGNYGMFVDDGNFTAKNFANWVGSAAQSGLGLVNKSLADTADVILGAPLKKMGWEKNPISSMSDYFDQAYINQKYNADLYAQRLGGGAGYEFGESFLEGTVAALPTALMAFMTGGASTTATTASLTQQAAYQGADILTKAGMTGANLIKDPQY